MNIDENSKRPTYQVIWWWGPLDWHIGFKRLDLNETSMALVYKWILCIGPLEIRKCNYGVED
jgi:hypothetical protein